MWLLCCTICQKDPDIMVGSIEINNYENKMLNIAARRQEIIKMTEQLIESINTGDFEAYT